MAGLNEIVAAVAWAALRCVPQIGGVPQVPPETIVPLAAAESGLDPLALHVNGVDAARQPRAASAAEAVRIARQYIAAGYSVDLGLMQVNNRTAARIGLSLAEAFVACSSLAAGARVLADGYAGGADSAAQQHALRVAFSVYNTGLRGAGFRNGYVRRVEAAAARILPALRLAWTPAPLPAPAGAGSAAPAGAGSAAPAGAGSAAPAGAGSAAPAGAGSAAPAGAGNPAPDQAPPGVLTPVPPVPVRPSGTGGVDALHGAGDDDSVDALHGGSSHDSVDALHPDDRPAAEPPAPGASASSGSEEHP